MSLRSGNTKSCGCLQRDIVRQLLKTHGLSHKIPEYNIWQSMKQRCTNRNVKQYKDYGGRGIRVCERWLNSFVMFLKDMGRRPSERHTLERVDNNDGYNPKNCKWVLMVEQAKNKRNNHWITINGETKHLAEWSRIYNIPYKRVSARVNNLKWDINEALFVEKNIRYKPNRKPRFLKRKTKN